MKRLAPGRPRLALIVAPHADDETIGAYGLIATLRARGTRVRVIVVTDGAGSHRASPTWPRPRLVAARRQETRRAMRPLGVTAGEIGFLDLPDGEGDRGDRRGAIARTVRRARGCDLIVAPSTLDAHPDHRMVAAELARVAAPGARRLGYLVWAQRGHRARTSALRTLPLGVRHAAKRAAIRRYRTQMGAITDDPGGFAISRRQLAAFSRPSECYEAIRWW